jgi:RNA polymerase sigma-70 factor (ECF subfamily)
MPVRAVVLPFTAMSPASRLVPRTGSRYSMRPKHNAARLARPRASQDWLDLDDIVARTTIEPQDDASALRAMQAGDRDAVAVLYDRYSSAAYGLALRITNDATMAEDAVQEAFVSVWRQCGRFDATRGQVRSWLLTIIHHKAVDAVRRRAGRAERSLPEEPETFVSSVGNPVEIAEWSLEAAAVREAMRLVPDDQRQTIEMAYFMGFTHVEIAERMSVPLGTVKSRLRIGLEKMRDHLAPKVLE